MHVEAHMALRGVAQMILPALSVSKNFCQVKISVEYVSVSFLSEQKQNNSCTSVNILHT